MRELFTIEGDNVIVTPASNEDKKYHVMPVHARLSTESVSAFPGKTWMEPLGWKSLIRIDPAGCRYELGRIIREPNFPPVGWGRINQDGTVWPENLRELVNRPNWTLSDDLRRDLSL